MGHSLAQCPGCPHLKHAFWTEEEDDDEDEEKPPPTAPVKARACARALSCPPFQPLREEEEEEEEEDEEEEDEEEEDEEEEDEDEEPSAHSNSSQSKHFQNWRPWLGPSFFTVSCFSGFGGLQPLHIGAAPPPLPPPLPPLPPLYG